MWQPKERVTRFATTGHPSTEIWSQRRRHLFGESIGLNFASYRRWRREKKMGQSNLHELENKPEEETTIDLRRPATIWSLWWQRLFGAPLPLLVVPWWCQFRGNLNRLDETWKFHFFWNPIWEIQKLIGNLLKRSSIKLQGWSFGLIAKKVILGLQGLNQKITHFLGIKENAP